MDAATWLKQMGDQSVQTDKRARLAELLAYISSIPALDDLLFEATDRISAFLSAERTTLFMSDAQGQLRSVAWVEDSARELRLPRDASNVIGFAYSAKDPLSFKNLNDASELAHLHPRLRPDDRLDRWLGISIRGAIVAPLLVGDLPFGVMLLVNRQDEFGLFVPRDLVHAGAVGRAVATALAGLLAPQEATTQPTAASARARGTTAAFGHPTTSAPEAEPPRKVTPVPETRVGATAPKRSRKKPANKWDTLVSAGILPLETLTKALADPSRVRVLLALQAGELCVCQVAEVLSVPASSVSEALRELRRAGFVTERKEGRWVFVSIPVPADPLLTSLLVAIDALPETGRDRARIPAVTGIPVQDVCRKHLVPALGNGVERQAKILRLARLQAAQALFDDGYPVAQHHPARGIAEHAVEVDLLQHAVAGVGDLAGDLHQRLSREVLLGAHVDFAQAEVAGVNIGARFRRQHGGGRLRRRRGRGYDVRTGRARALLGQLDPLAALPDDPGPGLPLPGGPGASGGGAVERAPPPRSRAAHEVAGILFFGSSFPLPRTLGVHRRHQNGAGECQQASHHHGRSNLLF